MHQDAFEHAGRWYQDFELQASWHEARQVCQSMGGDLAVVDTPTLHMKITSRLGDRWVWLGASDAKDEGEWRWVNGTPVIFAPWYSGEPTDTTTSEDEDFLTMNIFWRADGRGSWADSPPNNPRVWGMVCAWTSVAFEARYIVDTSPRG